jgi:hypothetical protein
MAARGVIEGACAITSLPDVSEVNLTLAVWRGWFLDAARRVIDAVPEEGAAMFFQSDIKQEGAWVDKGALVTRAAEEAGARILFHKIVCRLPPGTLTYGRPGFTHFIAVSRKMICPAVLPIPDVITDPGPNPGFARWARGRPRTPCALPAITFMPRWSSIRFAGSARSWPSPMRLDCRHSG